MKYRNVRYRGGKLEIGKDVTMWDGEEVIGVVVKARPITGNAAKENVAAQVLQSLGSTVIDRRTNLPVPVARCIVVSSFDIANEAEFAILPQFAATDVLHKVRFIDGTELVDLLIEHRSPSAIISASDELLDTLKDADPTYGIHYEHGPKGRLVSIVPKSPDAPPLPLRLNLTFPSSKTGRMKLANFVESIERGTPLTLGPEYVSRIVFPDVMQSLLAMPNGRYAIEFGAPEPKTVALAVRIFSNDDEFSLPYLEMTVERAGTKEVELNNDRQPIQFGVKMTIRDEGTAFDVAFRAAGAAFDDLLEAEKLNDLRRSGATVNLRFLKTGVETRSVLPPSPNVSPSNRETIERIVRLGRRIGVRFPLPKEPLISRGELSAIANFERIVTGSPLPVTEFTLSIDQCEAIPDGAPIYLASDDSVQSLFGTQISLGPWSVRCEKYRREVVGPSEVRIVPENAAYIVFSRWQDSGVTIAPGSGPSTDVPTPVASPPPAPAPAPTPERKA